MGKTEGQRPLGRHGRRWEGNIKVDLEEMGWKGVNWICLAEDRDKWRDAVNTAMKLRVVLNVLSLFTVSGIVGSSSSTLLHAVS